MKIQPRKSQSRFRGKRPPLAFACASLLALAASITLTGCASFRMWGQKSSGSPGSVGGALNIPFGGK
jgi:hypothetical protein